MATLRTRDLTKSHGGRTVVRGVSLEIARRGRGSARPERRRQDHHVLDGRRPDGARPWDAFLDGADVTDDPMHIRARKGIGYLPQEASIFRGLTVEQNILAILETSGRNGVDRRPAAAGPPGRARLTPLAKSAFQDIACRAASGGASRSRGRWSFRRSSCCSTSRLRASTPSP